MHGYLMRNIFSIFPCIPTIVSILITKKIIFLEVPILIKHSLHLDVQPSVAFIFGHISIPQTGKTYSLKYILFYFLSKTNKRVCKFDVCSVRFRDISINFCGPKKGRFVCLSVLFGYII